MRLRYSGSFFIYKGGNNMPNWTDVTLRCDGLSNLPIFSTDDNGEKYFDYNKIVPMPEFTKNTISPVREDCVLNFLLKENSLEDALAKFKDYGFELKDEYKNLSKEEILEKTDKTERFGISELSPEISAYDLGKNYVTSHEETGSWNWYEWAYSNWGVKWNASDCYLDGDTLSFMAPWGYPDKVFDKMAEMFPDKNFYAEIIYEDDFENIYTIDFSADHVYEDTKINPAYLEEIKEEELNKETDVDYIEEQENNEKITVLCINPGKEPEVKQIDNNLESLQSEVGGLIECLYPWADSAGIICNEEGKINGLPLNRALRRDDGEIYDVIAGTMLIVGLTEDNFGSLTSEQIDIYTELFKKPEIIMMFDGKIAAIPCNDYKQIPVYYNNSKYAMENSELTAFRESFKANVACKQAIEQILSDCYKDNALDSKTAYELIISQFGEERTKVVLANTCIHKDLDERISTENKSWANSVKLLDCKDSYGNDNSKSYVCEKPHIGLVNLLISKVRKETTKEKSIICKESVLNKLDENKGKIKPSDKIKNKGIEI